MSALLSGPVTSGIIALGAVVGALAVILGALRPLRRMSRAVDLVLGDAEDNTPGLAQRLASGDSVMSDLTRSLALLDERTKQLLPNGGHSLADKIAKDSSRLERVEVALHDLRESQVSGALEARRERGEQTAHLATLDQRISEMRSEVAVLKDRSDRVTP